MYALERIRDDNNNNNNITNEFINYTMEIDPEEVKRHLDMLGYTHVEPNLLDEFVKGMKV